MSVLDEMRKRVESNKANIVTKNTALDEMRKRVNERKNEIDKQNKKAQEFNQYIQNNDLSKVQGLKLPNALSHERVNEILQSENKKEEEIEYYKNNPATFGSNLNRNLLQPIGRTIRNAAIATGDAAVDVAEYLYELQAVPLSLDELINRNGKTTEELIREKRTTPSQIAKYTESVRQKALQKTQELPTPLARKIAESGMVVGDMVPSIALGATPLGAYGATIGIFARSASNAQQEALNNGATYEQARLNGVLNGLLETTVEMIGGKAIGKLTKMPTLTSKIGGKLLSKAPKGVKTFLELLKDVGEEGLEEMISDFVQPYIDRVTYNPEAPLASFKSQWEAFSSSIIPSLMFAGINVGTSNVISYVDKQLTIKNVNNQINNLANKQIEQIENTDLSMTEKVALINDVKKQQIEAKNKFAEEINKFETTETTMDTNLKTIPQNYTNFAKTTPINEKISQKNVQNVSNLQKTVQNNSTIQGLEDYTEQDIKDLVSDYIQDLDINVQIKGIAINGSRARGDSQVTSDLDVVVEYDGDMSEDALFNILNEEPLIIDGIQVDINPITASKSGTLEQYMQKSQEYDAQKYEESDVFEDRASYDVDINKENEYNIDKESYDNYDDNVFLDFDNGIDIGKNTDFLRSSINAKYNGKPPINTKKFILWRNNAYIYSIDGEYKLKIYGVIKIEGNEDIIKFYEEVYSDNADKINESTEKYGVSTEESGSGKGNSNRNNLNVEKRGTDRTNDTIFNESRNGDRLRSDRKRNGNIKTNIENSEEQGSFSMELTPEEKLEKYEEEREESLRRIAKKAGMGYSYLDANKGETQREMFFLLRHSETLREQFIQENNINLEGKTSSDKYDLIDGNPEFEKFINKITDEYFKGNRPELTDEEVMEIAQDIHGTTDDYSVGAYMTIDGELLDFDDGGYRDDHRTIGVPTYTMVDFMNAGNIRMQPEGSGFEVIVEPTDAQYERLADYIDNYLDGEVYVDVSNEKGVSIAAKNYPQGTSSKKILDDLSEYFRTGKFRKRSELDDFREPRAEYENQMKLNMDVTSEVVESAKNYNGGLKPIVIGHRIWEGYKKQGYIDLNNTKVSTAQDMAEIAQIFRNPYYETFRVIYTKGKGRNKVIVGQEALSSFLPSSVNVVNKDNTLMKMTYQMKDRMQRLSADGYYLIHNHPSGEATASQNDIRLTEKIAQKVPGFHEHIIVDHGTYAYIYMTLPGLSTGGKAVAVDNLDVDSSNSAYNQEDFTSDMVNGGMYINTRGVLVELASKIRHDENYSSLILTDVKHKLNAIIDVPNVMFNMRPEQIEGYIKNTAKKYGANEAFIATQDDTVFKKLKKTLTNIRDIVLYDKTTGVRAGEQGESVFYKEESSSKRTSMRVSEETKEERIERVRKYVEETQKSIGTLGTNISRKDIVTRIIDNYGITTKGNSKELNRVSKEIQEHIRKGSFTDNRIQGYAEQLIENLKVTIDDYYKANKELKELIRRTKLYASDSVKAGFIDWADFRKSNVGTIRATNDADALPVDTFYQELTEMYGEAFFPSDIVNPSDQLQKIADVAKKIKVIDMTLKQNIDENFGEEAREEIVKGLIENFKTLREQMTGEIKDVVETPEIKTRRWSKTVRNNDMVQTFLDKDLQDYKYVVRSNKATIAQANETLMRKGYDESIKYFDAIVESGKFPTVDDIALGERLIQEAIKRGEFEKATEIIADVSILGTELGQAVQAMSMISRLSPAGQLMYLERAVKRINEKQQTKRKKPSKKKKTGLDKVMDESKVGDIDIKITDEMKKDILSAKTPEELEVAVTRVKEQIAAQLPVEMAEKLSEWRYLAMLGNPKTHIRNTVGNLVMVAPYEMKNLYQRIIETTFNSKLEERTKTFKKSTEVVKLFVEDMVEQNKDTLTGNGYTNIQSELKNMRKIYKTKVLETLKKANMKALDFEDFVFKKRAFKSTLAEYLTANDIRTEKDIQENPELIQKGINFAIEEAKKATFNQYNSVATAISRFESDKTIGKILVGGLAPFKRTPLNIVKTAWQYSPAGLAETLTFRTMDLKNGLITANDYIERISQGLTGVSITAIGFLLASMGVLTGSMGSKKKDKYEQSIGLRVPYSIKAGDRYVDISWLSPSAIPLLIGAELYSLADDGESGLSIDGIIKVLEKMMNPISEMTMLSTFNDALINYAGEDNEISGLAGILDTVVKSYIGQAFPTLGSQINKIIDPTVRTTKVSKNSKFKTGEQIVRTNMNKFIGLSYLLEPSTDIWGNIQKRSDNVVLRSIDSLFNPASVVENKSTSVDKEIMKLYEINQNDDIIPKTPNNYFTLNGYKYEFSAEEYTDFKITYGQTAYKELQKLFRTAEYKGMATEYKEKAIKEVYDLAQQKAREEYGITPDALIREYGEKEAVNRLLDNKQLPKYEMAKKNIELSLKQYYEAYNAQESVEGKKDAKGKTISGTEKTNRINEMEKAGLTKSQATQMYKILEGKL